MRLELRLFRSRLARRFFGVFIACAILPIIALAGVSYYRVTRQLEDQAVERLRQSAKSHGLSIYERLLLVDHQLQIIDALLIQRKGPKSADLPPNIAKQNETMFSGLASYRNGHVSPVLGGPRTTAASKEVLRRTRAEGGDILLVTLAGEEKWPEVALVRRTSGNDGQEAYLIGIIDRAFLWGLKGGSILPPGVEFVVWDDQGRALHDSLGSPAPRDKYLKATSGKLPGGQTRLTIGKEPYYGFCWSAFLKPKFRTPYWSVMALESRGHVLQPLQDFQTVFLLIVLLSFFCVVWLSSRAIRKSLVPIDSLMEGARHVAARQFIHQVVVDSSDEFHDLAVAFNRMTSQLDVQFKGLEVRSELDRAILSVLEMEHVITTSLDHLGVFLPHRTAAISIIEAETPFEGQSYIRDGERPTTSTTVEPFRLSRQEFDLLLENAAWLVIDARSVRMPYLRGLLRPEVTCFVVLPIWIQSKLFAVVSLGIDTTSPDQQALEQVRGFSDHLAVAFSNSNLVKELKELNLGTLHALARTVDAKSAWTAGHSVRVSEMAARIGRVLALPQNVLEDLERAALLHDIGKIGIPLRILDKTGNLTKEEYDTVKEHPSIGARILSPIRAYESIIPAVEQHHERYDGRGYPRGAKGDAIHLMARIMAVADAFDAVVSDRPYRKGLARESAIKEIQEGAGRQFDPEIAEAFCRAVRQGDFALPSCIADGAIESQIAVASIRAAEHPEALAAKNSR